MRTDPDHDVVAPPVDHDRDEQRLRGMTDFDPVDTLHPHIVRVGMPCGEPGDEPLLDGVHQAVAVNRMGIRS